ncbi:MAG TPA: AAA family ATPase [Stellaceae bacterium]|jgi:hypothetical protein|nr:AAA family ATPase [Stellaceae bacterium]
MDDPQRDVIAFLHDPASYPPDTGPIKIVETHISLVFMVGTSAYKLKRAVKYPYLDFSTLEQRLAGCTAELKLNRRTAPQLYLEVRAISRRADGSLAWGRQGEVLDFVVVMRRFDDNALLETVAASGGLSAPLMLALATHIAAFHDKAETSRERGGAAAMADLVEANLARLRERADAGFPVPQIERIETGLRRELRRAGAMLDERREAGKVRRGHGDLHLRNICLLDGQPVLFDAIEFSEDLGTIDVLYDLAFLLMDLNHRGHGDFANLVLNRYLDLTEEDEGLAAMPLFMSLRAVIRAHVTATMAEHGWGTGDAETARAEARRYLDDAEMLLCRAPARLLAVGGLSGAGKSTLAVRLAPDLGVGCGARVLRSDVLRKLRFGTEPESPLPPEAYTEEVTARVYADLCARAAMVLQAGSSAIIDAVALLPAERRAFAAVAADAGVPFTGLWLAAPEQTMRSRIAARRGDASDASAEVLARQLDEDPGELDWLRLDAGGSQDALLAAARRVLMH